MLKPLLFGIALSLFLFACDWIGQHNYGRILGAVGFVILIPVFIAVIVRTVRGK